MKSANKAFAHNQEVRGAKRAVLDLKVLKNGERTRLVESFFTPVDITKSAANWPPSVFRYAAI